MESCATPIFCLLLAEGFRHTADPVKYIVRVLGVAALSEIPYNLCMAAKFIDLTSRNPAFGLGLSLIMLYLYGYFRERNAKNILMKIVVTVAAIGFPMVAFSIHELLPSPQTNQGGEIMKKDPKEIQWTYAMRGIPIRSDPALIVTDPNGSYTGRPADLDEKPIQDADDL